MAVLGVCHPLPYALADFGMSAETGGTKTLSVLRIMHGGRMLKLMILLYCHVIEEIFHEFWQASAF